MLTKLDIAAMRAANTLCVHLTAHNPTGLVRLIKHADRSKDVFAQDAEHVLADCEVNLYGFHNRTAIRDGGKCFSLINFYHSQHTPASCIIRTLRIGDVISFQFYPDAHSNQYVKNAGLHADVLYMNVKRGDKRFTWKLDCQVCPNNSARMCHNVGVPKEYALA